MNHNLPLAIDFGRDTCSNLSRTKTYEWLISNGLGGYGSGTISGILSRTYHGLLVAALDPPLERTLLLTKLDETVTYQNVSYTLNSDQWLNNTITGHGYRHLERFRLEGTTPVWSYSFADAVLEKRIWMKNRENTTYVQYCLHRGSSPLQLSIKAMVNYRNHHDNSQRARRIREWNIQKHSHQKGIEISMHEQAASLYISSDAGQLFPADEWYQNYLLENEMYRGLDYLDDNYHAATLYSTLHCGETITIAASTNPCLAISGESSLIEKQRYEISLLEDYQIQKDKLSRPSKTPPWIQQLLLSADQFLVQRTNSNVSQKDKDPTQIKSVGRTIIAGYPWFSDWGRDTMIALPGLTLTTGRAHIARSILRTFSSYLDKGMLPNIFPEIGETPGYNTIDAVLWYFEAIRAYVQVTNDLDLLEELMPGLQSVVDWYMKGTRYGIKMDPDDHLVFSGEHGTQLTWMDVKVDDWVVTPRTGKPIEVNALWYNAIMCMAQFSQQLNMPTDRYALLSQRIRDGFQRFWMDDSDYCYDVIDGSAGNDSALRPNQIFAVSLPYAPPLSLSQQKAIVDSCSKYLVTSYGMRSLSIGHSDYIGTYGGSRTRRDGSYHQGTVWSWLIGPFVQAHLKVYQDPALARNFLLPFSHHLQVGCVGTISEIFDGDPPFHARGAFSQAWSVSEIIRAWHLLDEEMMKRS